AGARDGRRCTGETHGEDGKVCERCRLRLGDRGGPAMTHAARIPRLRLVETPSSAPQYEVRTQIHGLGDTEIEIWEMPSPASPQLKSALRIAGLRGRNLELVEHRVLKRLTNAGVRLPRVTSRRRGYNITEDLALHLGLLFRTL